MKTLLFVPCFNCRDQVTELLKNLNAVEFVDRIHTVMVVDNHSSDGTSDALNALVANGEMNLWPSQRLVVQINRRNKGLGGSFRDTALWAKGNGFSHLALFHGDHQARLEDLREMLNITDLKTTVLGARFMKGASLKNYSLRREWANRALNRVFSQLMGQRIYDIGSGLNIYRLDDLREDFLKSLPGHIAFDLKVLFHLVDHGKKFQFHPISWRSEKERSTINEWEIGFLVLKLLVEWKFKNRKRKRIHVVFPMAGKGSRFRERGFENPKPFLKFQKQSFFRRSLRSVMGPLIKREFDISLTVITSAEDQVENQVREEVLDHYPTVKFSSIQIQGRTQGPVETLLFSKKKIAPKDSVLIVDCDLEFVSPKFFDTLVQEAHIDGALVTFESHSSKYSFVNVAKDGRAIRVAEKEAISDRAVIGAYFFKSASVFFAQAQRTLKAQRKSREVFVSHVIQDLISQGKYFRVTESTGYKSFGTPEELENLLEGSNNFSAEESQSGPSGISQSRSTSELHSEP